MEKYFEHFVAFVAFIFSAGISVRTADFLLKINFFDIERINTLIATIITLIVLIFSYHMLRKIILFVNIKPTLTEKEFRKRIIKIKDILEKKRKIKEEKRKV